MPEPQRYHRSPGSEDASGTGRLRMGREERRDPPAPSRHSAGERLDSWKGIASYLKRNVRTVRRWEKAQGLPVRRHPYLKRGLVYAYKVDLDAWWNDGHGSGTRPQPRTHATAPRIMLAVLPFENFSGDPEQDYFSDGLTVEVITQLGRLDSEGLGVIARTSVMQYKGTRKDVSRIGSELGAAYVLEGSVRRAGRRLRVNVQLIQTRDQSLLWTESYDRDLSDILTLQSDLARAITPRVGLALTPRAQGRLASPRAVDPLAFEAYLKGRFHWYRLSPEHLDMALEYFQTALEHDPGCALAHAGIADVWFVRSDSGHVPSRVAFPKAKTAALRAIELDDALAEAHVNLANCRFANEWDWDGAEREFRRAIQLNPNSADAHFMYADFLISLRRSEAAMAHMELTRRLDPFNPFFQCFLGWHLVYLGRHDAAVEQLREAARREPGLAAAHLGLWGALHEKRSFGEALAEARAFFTALGDREVGQALAAVGGEGDYRRAMRSAAAALAARSRRKYVPAVRVARLFAHAAEKDEALHWLEKAVDEREPPLVHLLVAWDWGGLRDEARFRALLDRVRFPV